MSNQPLSEQFRLKALQWVEADKIASIMEEMKSVRLAQHIQNMFRETKGKLTHAEAERTVKANPKWEQEIRDMVAARTNANRLKVELEALRIQHAENQSFEANRRAEMKLY